MDSSPASIATTTLLVAHGDKQVTIEAVAGDHIAATINASKNFYEWQFLGELSQYIKAGDLVLDVGANIGNHSLYFAAVCGAQVISFEPLPLAAEILQRNVDSNSLQEHIEVRRKALGEGRSKAKLDKMDLSNVGATTFELSPEGDFDVSALDLEGILERVSLIKVDAEGMDLSVLKGATELISRDRPIIACEAATAVEQVALERFASEIGYAFVAEFNATPTYILAPAGTPLERARVERRSAGLLTRTHWATRDLYYRVGLVNTNVKSLSDAQTPSAALDELAKEGARAQAALVDRVERLEAMVEALTERLASGAEEQSLNEPQV
ncbi:FkbM family methyltransferase [Paenarthrobacter nicotinovorans]|uniref:FkbM family methyltransferase n=1 Tax=Paenarthrobacter nicotinovorans TaxID=29320 RepID=A0ABV0GVI0_PAENI